MFIAGNLFIVQYINNILTNIFIKYSLYNIDMKMKKIMFK